MPTQQEEMQRAQAERLVAEQAQAAAAALAHVMEQGASQMSTQRDRINAVAATVQQRIAEQMAQQEQAIQTTMSPIQQRIMNVLQASANAVNQIPMQPAPTEAPFVGPIQQQVTSRGLAAQQQQAPPPDMMAPPLAESTFPESFNPALTGELPPPSGGLDPSMVAPVVSPFVGPPAPELVPSVAIPAPAPAPPPPPPADPQIQALIDYGCYCLCKCLHASAVAGRDPVDLDQPLAMMMGEQGAAWHHRADSFMEGILSRIISGGKLSLVDALRNTPQAPSIPDATEFGGW